MNISNDTIEALSEVFYIWFGDGNVNEVPANIASTLHIGIRKEDGQYIGKCIKATKKEITFDYVMNKLHSDSIYKNFSSAFRELLPIDLRNSITVYATTYGIGVFVAVGIEFISPIQTAIESKLNELGIQYDTEYSSARWVFRYKISKSWENIERLKIA